VPELTHLGSGKIRELYDAGAGQMLLVASDRISAFDVVLPTPIPQKGRVLTGISAFWFAQTASIVPNHLISLRAEDVAGGDDPELRGRSMLVRRLSMLPVEFVVRGYLAGSGWLEYEAKGSISGVSLPPGLRLADPLPEPVVTPAFKSTSGHDENITADAARELCGGDAYDRAAAAALAVYRHAATHASGRGIVLADTKFEFGLDASGEIVLADEVLTPDSSRFWPADSIVPGESPPSYDKQYVRDWLLAQPWDKTDPGPELPREVAEGTAARYREAYDVLVGRPFSAYLEEQGVECA
jgi:phosphoribosylaminoimidazole-succinocarboxamide synthase